MQDCESVENVGTADRSVEHVADVEVDVAGKVDGETNGVPLVVAAAAAAAVVVFAGVLAVVAAAVAAAVNAVDAKSVDVATAADFELDVLDGIPDYPT